MIVYFKYQVYRDLRSQGCPIVLFRTTFLAVSSLVLSIPSFGAVSIVGSRQYHGHGRSGGIVLRYGAGPLVGLRRQHRRSFDQSHLALPAPMRLGGYAEISFDFQAGVARHASIRTYHGSPERPLHAEQPHRRCCQHLHISQLSRFPGNLDHLTFSGIFAPPSFWDFASDSPWVFFDRTGKSFILSPASNFMTASHDHGTEWRTGQRNLHRHLHPARAASSTAPCWWWRAASIAPSTPGDRRSTALSGKTRPANDADVSLNKIGYWTDNGAAYYYQMAGSMTYEQTLAAVKSDFDRAGIRLGYLQLDSWFYPKGSGAAVEQQRRGHLSIRRRIAALHLRPLALPAEPRRSADHPRALDRSQQSRTARSTRCPATS